MQSKHTPWGLSHSEHNVAPGIVSFTTGSHGGIQLSADRISALPQAIRDAQGSDLEWYEEDCAVNLVVIAFPDAFPDISVWSAVKFLRVYDGYPTASAYVESNDGLSLLERHKRFEDQHGDKYVARTQCSSSSGWDVHFRRIRDGAEAIARGLSSSEAFAPSPVDITAFGDRVTFA